MDSPKEQQKNDRSKCYEKIIHDIMTRTEQSSYLSTNSTIPSRDDDPRSNESSSPGERLSRRRMSTDRPRRVSASCIANHSVFMFDVGESPTGKTKIDLTMLDPLVFPSLPLAKGMGHDVQGLRRSVSSTSHGGAQSTSRSSVPSNHSASSRRNSATNGDYYRESEGCWLLEKSEDTQPLVVNTCPILAENIDDDGKEASV